MQKYFSRKITRKFFYSFAFFLITSFLTGTILFPVKIVSLASSGNSMENSLNPLSDNSGINELSNRLKNITTSNNISVQAATDSTSNVSYQTNSESSSASSANTGFQSAAPNAILMEATTGTILYEKDADKEKPPASVTKVMTLLLIFEALSKKQITLNDTVTVSEHAASMGGSQVFLEPGETQSVDTINVLLSPPLTMHVWRIRIVGINLLPEMDYGICNKYPVHHLHELLFFLSIQ